MVQDAGRISTLSCNSNLEEISSFAICAPYPNDVPGEYFAPIDHTGVRVDRLQRPELTLGTVDFMVPKEYWSRQPVAMRWLFLIDVSAEAVNRGFLHGFCEGILSALYGAPDKSEASETTSKIPKAAKVGIVTFDKEMHFYNLSSNLGDCSNAGNARHRGSFRAIQ